MSGDQIFLMVFAICGFINMVGTIFFTKREIRKTKEYTVGDLAGTILICGMGFLFGPIGTMMLIGYSIGEFLRVYGDVNLVDREAFGEKIK